MYSIINCLVGVFVAFVAYKLFNRPDINNDGKVDVQDVVAAAKVVATEVKAETLAVVEKVKKARKAKSSK